MATEIQNVVGTAYKVDFRSLLYAASTHPQPDISFPFGKPTSERWVAPTTEDEEERKWKAFFARSDVQAELERLAEEAEREFAAGEIEEGGFAVE